MIKKYENLSAIPARQYEGYVWMSDSKTPEVLIGKSRFSFSTDKGNPFVIEALLYSREENISITVKHTGRYHIHEVDLGQCPQGAVLESKTYLPHRLKGISKLSFKQLWIPEKDDNCMNMEVLTLKATLFTGFTQ